MQPGYDTTEREHADTSTVSLRKLDTSTVSLGKLASKRSWIVITRRAVAEEELEYSIGASRCRGSIRSRSSPLPYLISATIIVVPT
jgi:hypothetical protein